MKKNISILYDFLSELGGLERVMFFQANTLAKKFNVSLGFSFVSKKKEDEILTELELKNKKSVFSMFNSHSLFEGLSRAMAFPSKAHLPKTDLVISHSFMTHRIAQVRKKKYKTPYIAYIHHPPNFLYAKKIKGWANNKERAIALMFGKFLFDQFRKMDIKAVKGADLVLVNSNYTAQRVREIYGTEPKILYPPISDYFKVVSEKDVNKFKKSKKITRPFFYAHGRIIPDKNYHSIIPLMKSYPDFDLIISGNTEKGYLEELNRIINKEGLTNRIKVLGRISKEDLLGYYNSASLFLMPAHKEDFGLTVVESVSCGLPVVAWDDGAGPSEILTNGLNGYLAKPYLRDEFTLAINKTLTLKKNKHKISHSVDKFRAKSISKEIEILVSQYLISNK